MTPTLSPERTDEIRTFLVTEAAASVADRRPTVLTPTRRRIVVGAATAALLAGGIVAAQSVGGPAPSAIAVEVDGEWTTIRLVDIDADPDAVVQQLIDAGFDARREPLVAPPRAGAGGEVTELNVYAVGPDGQIGMIATGGLGEEGGARGLVGLSVSLPDGPFPAGRDGGGLGRIRPAGDDPTVDLPAPPGEADLAGLGIRFEPDGSFSFRSGTELTIIVHTER